ncbi:MAG: magnesium transporter [Luteibacter sp.]|uniref:magnesium transporter n=1 Tax=Rhodanobacteraceae TaxID=1775411 RepID=UPI0008879C80|nr:MULTISPECIES: magnesium transporter [Rhodanobacteraceae]MDQ7996757.1 magnesium transporter [Luteibacter sp.]MDQ8050812.1 magnesium transporter [Luteibacter sp.]MDR6643349.1 magnesium transporter [Luteibacter sp. 1214]SDF25342.1 magnesium transporter [Dyella sp. 333MFSha]SKB51418.1 magnesium transporter [Luteibacter sp. 22Crub2.1]
MSEAEPRTSTPRLHDRLEAITELLRRREGLLEYAGAAPNDDETALGATDAELQSRLDELHPADLADVLESLPLEDRLAVWQRVRSDRDGEILLEVSDSVREALIADMDDSEILAAVEPLDADELADLVDDLPTDVLPELMASLDAQERERVQAAMSFEDDQVGALMDFDMVTIREDISLEVVLRYLRRFEELPAQTDKLFVVNSENVLTGVLPLHWLLVNSPDKMVHEIMAPDVNTFRPEDDAYDVAQAFERYDLVTAPVIDHQQRLIGRIAVDAMLDFIREESETEALSRGGLREEEDIFASVWKSVRNRWAWLAINLITAFIASRVIGLFEHSIEKLVALAALMPIVAGIGGNSGNQTITMIVRAMALEQVGPSQAKRLWRKELGVSLINGVVWGGCIGVVAWLLYGSVSLGLVMTSAMTLNLLLAAFMGVGIPMLMTRLGRDPALGSSVLITAVTDSGGFFIFLGLATIFLL